MQHRETPTYPLLYNIQHQKLVIESIYQKQQCLSSTSSIRVPQMYTKIHNIFQTTHAHYGQRVVSLRTSHGQVHTSRDGNSLCVEMKVMLACSEGKLIKEYIIGEFRNTSTCGVCQTLLQRVHE
jgi:hypothetical protein